MKIETPEALSARASSLLTKAIDACGGKDNLPLLNSYMSEAKAKRMTWVEGLEYAIRRRNTNCVSPDQLELTNGS